MKKHFVLSLVSIIFCQICLAQNGGLVQDSAYGEALFMNIDSTKIMSYSKIYSDHTLQNDRIELKNTIDTYLPDATVNKSDGRNYTYYTYTISEISYNREVDITKSVFKSYVSKEFKPGKEWKKVVFSSIAKMERKDETSFREVACVKYDDNGYKIIHQDIFAAAEMSIVLRENVTEEKLRLDEYGDTNCNFIRKQEPFDAKNVEYVVSKDLLILHFKGNDFFSLYFQWKNK
ncbi:hypothetical protein [Kordia sp.]|uniref:hypothetical protein n=1 Tax=Kordia sp. TaxID=1965332 RepID=UPI003B5A835E